jgi:hypothetical protein
MYGESVPNRNSPPAILLRETSREDGKVKKRTLLNLSDGPRERVEGWRALLKGGVVMPPGTEPLQVIRTLPHGHVSAVLGVVGKIGLDRRLGPHAHRPRDLVLAMIVSRIIAPASKLATTKGLNPMTATTSLGQVLGLGEVAYDELYPALDWLLARQPAIETALARRPLKGGTLVLYDVSSSYVEGRCCPLAKRGYNRDGKKGKLQIVYGLLCAADGCPVAVEVFKPAPAQAGGNTGDPKTLAAQIDKLKVRFGLAHVVLVGDRGMITHARIRQDVIPANLDWITALRAPHIKALAEDGKLQLTLFDERNMAVITSPDFPGERLIVCRNPDLAAARTRTRNDLLDATQRDLAAIKERVERKRAPLHGADKIGIAVGAVLGPHKMAKHFHIEITDDRFAFCRNKAEIAAETARDGIYVIRTNLPADAMRDPQVVASYKSLSQSLPRRRPGSSAPSARSRRSTSRSARSTTGSRIGSAPMCSCACSPITSNGTCAAHSPRCSTKTTRRRLSWPNGRARWPRRRARTRRRQRKPPTALPTACRFTASKVRSPTSVRSASIPSSPPPVPTTRSPSPLDRHRSRPKPSNCSASPRRRPPPPPPKRRIVPSKTARLRPKSDPYQPLVRVSNQKFSLMLLMKIIGDSTAIRHLILLGFDT